MKSEIKVRKSLSDDHGIIEELYPAAFPEEDLLELVKDLIEETEKVISLVATIDSQVVGHLALTMCSIEDHKDQLALLGPIAVFPDQQKNGVGSLLIKSGIEFAKESKLLKILVLGDPNYYGRFGFIKEANVIPPYPLPKEWADAWQSLALVNNEENPTGKLTVPKAWQKPELWSE